jgi:alpha-L-fucosidase
MSAATTETAGRQRLSLERLRAYEALQYGMFIHFGMSTYDGVELSKGDWPASAYAPDKLDVEQWVSVARDAGMKYAVLTTKHVAGFCLWPSAHTDYTVASSGNKADVVEAFVNACRKKGVLPGLYYCMWDNHHLFGSRPPGHAPSGGSAWYSNCWVSQRYLEWQRAQLEELHARYGPVAEWWMDIPHILSFEQKHQQYEHLAGLTPDAMIVMNHGITNGSKVDIQRSWPTDVMTIERNVPDGNRGYNPWHSVPVGFEKHETFYLPAEVCDPIGYEWFHVDGDVARSDRELLALRVLLRERKANWLLNVPPDRSGRIPQGHVDALMRLRANYERLSA